MLLASITDILYQSDPFWGKLDLDALRMLVSTCKLFRAELLADGKKKKKKVGQTLFDHALLTIMKSSPKVRMLSFESAKYRFALQVDMMTKHCVALPVEDVFHLSVHDVHRFKTGCFYAQIRFIDAYHLASKNGLKAAMERRHRFETKVLDSAREIVAALDGRLMPLRFKIRAAGVQLKKNLANLRKDAVGKKKVPGENELSKGIRLLNQLLTDLCCADCKLSRVRADILKKRYLSIEPAVGELKGLKKTLVARYRAHAVYCPALLTVDCLVGLE